MHANGSTNRSTNRSTALEFFVRFWSYVEQTDDCWLWKGNIGTRGYGKVVCDGKTTSAHRVAWMIIHGPIPAGMYVCHQCDVPACCRVDHLFLGTAGDNARDRQAKGRGADRRGERHGAAKLTDTIVLAMRQRRADGWTYARIGAEFGMDPRKAHRVVTGQRWKHLALTLPASGAG